jgi:hypothetical protein
MTPSGHARPQKVFRSARREEAPVTGGQSRSLTAVFTKPDDLPESALARALRDQWGFEPVSVDYQAVGFGSHHWLATDRAGRQLFVTADDLTGRLQSADDTADAAFGRLSAAFATALALHAEAGLTFVVAPLAATGGQVTARLSAGYSLVVHPYIPGRPAGEGGEFASASDRRAVLAMVTELHAATVGTPRADDFAVPNLHVLEGMLRAPHAAWETGPYAAPARALFHAHAGDLRTLVSAYRRLAGRVASRADRMVITHGEPHAGNVLVTAAGLMLVDWSSTLLAPPERDLWVLAAEDESLLASYTATTGTEIDQDALTLYRLWFDLADISEYLTLFKSAHQDTADTRESWVNLREFLRPAERWPGFLAPAG